MKGMKSGGGWAAIRYTLRMANRVGWRGLWKVMRAKNACKTCALGMGGQAGGMRNEAGHWPEVCKKSLQAMVADMQKGLRPEFFQRYAINELRTLTPRELEWCGRNAATHAPYQRSVALEQFLESSGIAPANEARQQFGIRRLRTRPAQSATAGDQREQRHRRHNLLLPIAESMSILSLPPAARTAC